MTPNPLRCPECGTQSRTPRHPDGVFQPVCDFPGCCTATRCGKCGETFQASENFVTGEA